VDTTQLLHYSCIVIQAGRELAVGGRRTQVQSGALKQSATIRSTIGHKDMHAYASQARERNTEAVQSPTLQRLGYKTLSQATSVLHREGPGLKYPGGETSYDTSYECIPEGTPEHSAQYREVTPVFLRMYPVGYRSFL
jgi:hypothetical protein